MTPSNQGSGDAEQVAHDLYERLIAAWNKRNARDYALQFASNGSIVGFDGSQVNGQMEIGAHVSEIFSHHQTASYVTIVREVRTLASDVILLRASAGMVPPGKNDLNPELNAVQSMVLVRKGGKWEIAILQNTPAAFHGRADDSKKLTEELHAVLRTQPPRD